MPDPRDDLRKILEGRAQAADAQAAFGKITASLPKDQVIPVLQDVLKGVQPPVLDHIFINVLYPRVQKEPEFVEQLQKDIRLLGADTDFWLVLLRVFDDMLKKIGKESIRQAFMEKLAHENARPVRLRASALRRLFLKPSSEAAKKLVPFLESRNPWLMNAAAHTIVQWQEEQALPAGLDLKPVYLYARQNINITRNLPAVLRLLANAPDPQAQKVLEDIAKQVTGHDRARFINTTGDKLPPQILAALILSVFDKWDNPSERTLQALLIEHRDRLDLLEKEGLHQAYLLGLSLLPDDLKEADVAKIDAIRKASPQVASTAARVLREAGIVSPVSARPSSRRNLTPREDMLIRLNEARIRAGNLFLRDPDKVANGFLTGLHKADALYVDLGFGFNIAGQHWHSGVFEGFLPSQNGTVGTLSVAQAGRSGSTTTNVFDFDCIEIYETSTSFESPEISVADTMQQLHDNFIEGFREFNNDLAVHAPRRTPGLTSDAADRITATAASFFDRGIDYTAFDMMNHKGSAWSGRVTDIQATRCDGVVEFSYERNGQIVCRGLNENRANISRRGVTSLENHNDLHLGSLEAGELCPRVQAGDQADNDHQGALNSRMSTAEGPVLPEVESFYVTPWFWIFPPMINFCVKAQRYNHVYVRITVSKDGGPFFFVHTDAMGTEESPDADWRFERVRTERDMVGFWLGKTTGGPDFQGQNGTYEFRLVAVDQGGNVSELRRAKVDIEWA